MLLRLHRWIHRTLRYTAVNLCHLAKTTSTLARMPGTLTIRALVAFYACGLAHFTFSTLLPCEIVYTDVKKTRLMH
jgi:hypothetical protein